MPTLDEVNEYRRYISESQKEKPPLGLTPKWIIDEHRMQDIHEAIMRYKEAHKEIPSEWIEEYISLCNV